MEDLFCHSDDVEDIDISPYDECIHVYNLTDIYEVISKYGTVPKKILDLMFSYSISCMTYSAPGWSPYLLERFSFECRKTKTKVITLTNHNSRKQSNEPIRARSKYMSPVPSAGKRVRVSHDWFWFFF